MKPEGSLLCSQEHEPDALTYLLTYLLTYSLTHSLTHSITHSMVQDIIWKGDSHSAC
jgi:hypothetical protein